MSLWYCPNCRKMQGPLFNNCCFVCGAPMVRAEAVSVPAPETVSPRFVPVIYTPSETDSLERRMLMKIHAITAQHLPNYSALTPEEIRAIHSAAFAGLDGEDPDYGF